MKISEILLQDYDIEVSNTRRTLERVPEGKNDWKCHDKSMPLGKLAMHCATLPLFGSYIILDDGMDMANSKRPHVPSFSNLVRPASAILTRALRPAATPSPQPPTNTCPPRGALASAIRSSATTRGHSPSARCASTTSSTTHAARSLPPPQRHPSPRPLRSIRRRTIPHVTQSLQSVRRPWM